MEIIAEAGSAHNGDIVYAQELIDAAAESGANYIKFQYIIASEILHKNTRPVVLFNKSVALYERFLALEQDPEFYARLAAHAQSRQIEFLCTPFGLQSAQQLLAIGVRSFKIASPELNHIPLLNFINQQGMPVFASTGLAHLGDIEESLAYLRHCKTTLLHCVTAYPAPEADYALSCIPHLRALFSVNIGCSDHSLDPIFIPLLAQFYGASHVEKHITLSKHGAGLDDPIAINPQELTQLCRESKEFAERLQHDGIAHSRAYLEERFSAKRVQHASGDGSYRLSDQEEKTYRTSRRSILACADLRAGQIISEENCALLRAEQAGTPGLHPRYRSIIIGKRVKKHLAAGQGITWDALL